MTNILQKCTLSGISTTLFPISLLVPRAPLAAGVAVCHANWIAENG
jgi:hypothetical protein